MNSPHTLNIYSFQHMKRLKNHNDANIKVILLLIKVKSSKIWNYFCSSIILSDSMPIFLKVFDIFALILTCSLHEVQKCIIHVHLRILNHKLNGWALETKTTHFEDHVKHKYITKFVISLLSIQQSLNI